jgi:hypothetical protein
MPLEALNRLTIGKLHVDVEDVIASFSLDEDRVASNDITDKQKHFFTHVLPEVINELDKEDDQFLSDFLSWCTAQRVSEVM